MPLDTSSPGFGRTDVGRALRTLAGAGPPDGSHLGRGKVGDDVLGALKELGADTGPSERRSSRRVSQGAMDHLEDDFRLAEVDEPPPSPIRASRKDSVPKTTRARLLADSDGDDASSPQHTPEAAEDRSDASLPPGGSDRSRTERPRSLSPEDVEDAQDAVSRAPEPDAPEAEEARRSQGSAKARSHAEDAEDAEVTSDREEYSPADAEVMPLERRQSAASVPPSDDERRSKASRESLQSRQSDAGAEAAQAQGQESEDPSEASYRRQRRRDFAVDDGHPEVSAEVPKTAKPRRAKELKETKGSTKPKRRAAEAEEADESVTSDREEHSPADAEVMPPERRQSDASVPPSDDERRPKASRESLQSRQSEAGAEARQAEGQESEDPSEASYPRQRRRDFEDDRRHSEVSAEVPKPEKPRRAKDSKETKGSTKPERRRAEEADDSVMPPERRRSDASVPPSDDEKRSKASRESLQSRQSEAGAEAAQAEDQESEEPSEASYPRQQRRDFEDDHRHSEVSAEVPKPQKPQRAKDSKETKGSTKPERRRAEEADDSVPKPEKPRRAKDSKETKGSTKQQRRTAEEADDSEPMEPEKHSDDGENTTFARRSSDSSPSFPRSQASGDLVPLSRSPRSPRKDPPKQRRDSLRDIPQQVVNHAGSSASQRLGRPGTLEGPADVSRRPGRSVQEGRSEKNDAEPQSRFSDAKRNSTPSSARCSFESGVAGMAGNSHEPVERAARGSERQTAAPQEPSGPLADQRRPKKSSKEDARHVERSKSPRTTRSKSPPVTAAPNLATARRSQQRSSVQKDGVLSRDAKVSTGQTSREQGKKVKPVAKGSEGEMSRHQEAAVAKSTMPTEEELDGVVEAAPPRVSRWARSRGVAPEVVADIATLPGQVGAEQRERTPPPPQPLLAAEPAFHWQPPPPPAQPAVCPPPPPMAAVPTSSGDSGGFPTPAMGSLYGWHERPGPEVYHMVQDPKEARRESQRQELIILQQQQQQLVAASAATPLSPSLVQEPLQAPPAPPPLSPARSTHSPRAEEVHGTAHRLAQHVLSSAMPAMPAPPSQSVRLVAPAAPAAPATPATPATPAAVQNAPVSVSTAYPRARELAEQKRLLKAAQGSKLQSASNLQRQMQALQEQQHQLLQKASAQAPDPTAPSPRTAGRSVSPMRSASPLQAAARPRSTSPVQGATPRAASRLQQPRVVVARPAKHAAVADRVAAYVEPSTLNQKSPSPRHLRGPIAAPRLVERVERVESPRSPGSSPRVVQKNGSSPFHATTASIVSRDSASPRRARSKTPPPSDQPKQKGGSNPKSGSNPCHTTIAASVGSRESASPRRARSTTPPNNQPMPGPSGSSPFYTAPAPVAPVAAVALATRDPSPRARSKTPPDPLAFKVRRSPRTVDSAPSLSAPTRLPRKPALPVMAKAKSEKNCGDDGSRSLSSFLPSDVKSVGFADKVMAKAGTGPEAAGQASNGKENIYLGFRNEQGQRDGFGVMQVENGPTYTGQWSGSKRDGHGTLFFEKGVFEGQWVQGNAHGKGIVHFKNGDTFQGGYEQNRKCGFGTYTWADGTTEAGEYLDGQKHGQHHWQRGSERWEMFYDKGALVGTQRTPATSEGEGAVAGETKKEFVAQKLVLDKAADKARPAPRPTPPPSPPSEPRQVPSSSMAPVTSSRCHSNSAFRAQGFTDEEIALMERKSPPGSPSPLSPLPDRAAQPGGHSGRVFFPTSARTRPRTTAPASAAPVAASAPELLRMGKGSAAGAAPKAAPAAGAADAAAGAAVEPPEPGPEVELEEEFDTDEPSTPGVHDA